MSGIYRTARWHGQMSKLSTRNSNNKKQSREWIKRMDHPKLGEVKASSDNHFFFLHTMCNSIGVGCYYTPQWLSESKSCLVTLMSFFLVLTCFFVYFSHTGVCNRIRCSFISRNIPVLCCNAFGRMRSSCRNCLRITYSGAKHRIGCKMKKKGIELGALQEVSTAAAT